ncbi:nucleoside-diphosphate kinase [Hyphococcus luteus]|uniref:Nucleoside-diphosphate kinase n=1 Tax=Hyphococcus luteus TaxID=2058213 RepID=A0A2S7KB14_9PROT|nr:nucleoside-diphosphate kinase [Marinicaulis flavus]PQA89704.1 nucleoside-diphosphate kinase [Marinicaulis flavus]
MSPENFILTERDFLILDALTANDGEMNPYFLDILRQKIRTASVVKVNEMPVNVATLGTRVSFDVNGTNAGERILAQKADLYPVGACLPITSLRGLALLGLTEGQSMRALNMAGVPETITLRAILYQPEAVLCEAAARALHLT